MSARPTYLDYAASAPLRTEALEAERAYDESEIAGANPNSLHSLGRAAARELDRARSVLARCLGGGFRPSDIVLTSGGTESNNLALLGLAEATRARDSRKQAVVVSAIEHDSVLEVARPLRERGFEVRTVRPGSDGVVSPEAVAEVTDGSCALVSVMAANNETGVIQPVAGLAAVAHTAGALFHTDAVQAFCRVPLDLAGVDAVSVAAHKLGGPVGVGALAVRGRVSVKAQVVGGGQELGRRGGTQDVRGAVAFAAVAEAMSSRLEESCAATSARADALYAKICAPGTGVVPTTEARTGEGRLPGIVSVMVPGLDSETLILQLDERGFEVSAGSACSSGSLDPSHVLSAMGIARNDALGSLRISFDERVSADELSRFADALLDVVSTHTGAHGRLR